ncbi:MAG: PorV/PorQ family protein, partial [Bacteroidia bacterium]|nr:PorV/PorQ family protein [Bacteroidia bacterium]
MKKGLLMVMGCCALGAQAQIGGTGVYSILKMPSNARTSAWGGYCPAYIKADVSFMNNNPALLGNAALNTVTSNFNTQFPGVWSGNGGYATKYKNIGYFGATVAFINYGSMKAYDAGGNAEGEVAANETVLSLGYAKPYNKNIQYGASAKMVYSILAGYVSSAMAFDIGATYTQDDSILSAGLVMKNAGFMVQHYRDGEREPLPFQVELGVNFKPRHMPFRFNLVAHNLQKFDLT